MSELLDEIYKRLDANAEDFDYVIMVVRDTLKHQNEKIESLQAKIDSLMLEYCPDEMTDEQLENWSKHQIPADI